MAPSIKKCFELLNQKAVPEHIIKHSMQVKCIAQFLARSLNQRGEDIDVEDLTAAALLHDITKMEGLYSGENHAKTGADLLRQLGYPRIADIVEQHVILKENEVNERITEEEILNYSDKRVRHDTIVTLRERYDDLMKRYGKKEQEKVWINRALQRSDRLEKKIFDRLGMNPDVLLSLHEGE